MKTVEDAQEDYVNNTFIEPDTYIGEIYDAFKAGYNFAYRWIPVGEELPPLDVPIVAKYILFEKECYWSGRLGSENRRKHFIESHLMITHWRLIDIK